MACPFFYPLARFESSSWIIPPRLPLGDPFAGECRAAEQSFQPDEDRMRHVCNHGYCRERCDRFPAAAQTDAIRFHVAEDAGALLRIQYIYEKDCWPRDRGSLEFVNGAVSGEAQDEVLRRQAAAFVESYLRRRG